MKYRTTMLPALALAALLAFGGFLAPGCSSEPEPPSKPPMDEIKAVKPATPPINTKSEDAGGPPKTIQPNAQGMGQKSQGSTPPPFLTKGAAKE